MEAERLFKISHLRETCRRAGIEEVTQAGRNIRFAPVQLTDSRQARLKRLFPGAMAKPAIRVIMVPLPNNTRRMGEALNVENEKLVDWVEAVMEAVFIASIGQN